MKLKYEFEQVEIDGEIMAVPVGENSGDLHSMLHLNETAAFILDCLKEEMSVDELAEKALKQYEGDKAEITEYIRDYVKKLEENGILE